MESLMFWGTKGIGTNNCIYIYYQFIMRSHICPHTLTHTTQIKSIFFFLKYSTTDISSSLMILLMKATNYARCRMRLCLF